MQIIIVETTHLTTFMVLNQLLIQLFSEIKGKGCLHASFDGVFLMFFKSILLLKDMRHVIKQFTKTTLFFTDLEKIVECHFSAVSNIFISITKYINS